MMYEVIMVGEGGFEPPKSLTTDLQSAPFGHSGTLPYYVGAGGRTRTPDLLITNQLLYQLSYTSTFSCLVIIAYHAIFVNSFFEFLSVFHNSPHCSNTILEVVFWNIQYLLTDY